MAMCERCGKIKLEDARCSGCGGKVVIDLGEVYCPRCNRFINGVCNPYDSNHRDGCYIATCVYGSYDCPEVWTLRQFRDNELSNLWLGRQFIRIYYAVSPKIVELFGNRKWFAKLWKPIIDKIVCKLQNSGNL